MKSKALKRQIGIIKGLKKFSYEVLLVKLACILLGIISSKGVIFGNYYPFGLSLASAVPERYAITTFIGILMGYFSASGLSKSLLYISITTVIAAIRWTLNDAVKVKKHSFYTTLVCFLPTLIISVFTNYSDSSEGSYIFISAIEATIASAAAYFFKIAFQSLNTYYDKSHMSRSQFACVMISLFIFALSISTITIGKLSVGRIVTIILILLSSYFMGVYGGSISGTSAGAIFAMSSFGMPYMSGAYAFSGMISGIFSKVSRLAVCGVFLLCSLIYFFQFFTYPIAVTCIYEIVCGTVIFALAPRRFLHSIKETFLNKKFFPRDLLMDDSKDVREDVKKGYIFETLGSISGVAESIANEMVYDLNSELERICMDSIYKDCKKCNLNLLCWDKNNKSTKEYFHGAITKILRGVDVERCIEDCEFKYRCNNIRTLVEDVCEKRDKYIAEVEASDRAKNLSDEILEKSSWVKSLVTYASHKMLLQREDINKSEKINKVLSKYGVKYLRSRCRINEDGKIFIEIEVDKKDYVNLFGSKLLRKFSSICDREMDDPVIFDVDDKIIVRIAERALFSVNVYLSGHVCNDGELCGDCCSYFYDGLGNFSAIISDGMGTGGKAAVDGAFTSGLIERLIKLQADIRNALNIANLSILGRSRDESLTAIDILKFDLFCGRAEFVKAGAPFTLVYSKGKITKVDSASLPIGIFNQTNISSEYIDLSPGDWILMMSDGVTDVGGDWIEEEFKNCINMSPKEISERILNVALDKRKNGYDDDITVLVISISKN